MTEMNYGDKLISFIDEDEAKFIKMQRKVVNRAIDRANAHRPEGQKPIRRLPMITQEQLNEKLNNNIFKVEQQAEALWRQITGVKA